MKAVILAGGLGSRLTEETTARPKPMVEIGGKPMLWHIMKIYSAHGVADLDMSALIEFHRRQGRLATVTAVQPPGRFGALQVADDRVLEFEEKPHGDRGWMNGGFFVLSPEVGRYLSGDETVWEQEPV